MSVTAANAATEQRGAVLDVLRELLAEGRMDAVLELVAKLVVRNGELERRLAELLARGRKSEGVSSAQLLLLIDVLAGSGEKERDDASAELRKASGIDEKRKKEPTEERPKRQPPLRRPIPPHLRRIDNPIVVPESERPCPKCGAQRKCIGHDVTEVVELIPAEIVVRRDMREKLACTDCEGELVRASPGDKVVSGGRIGCGLVAQVITDKYRDGLPLHRQRERFERLGLSLSVSTLADQVKWGTDLMRVLWHAAMDATLAAKVMHLDGTGLPILDRDAPGGKRMGTLWGYVGDGNAFYLYASTGKKVGQRPGELGPEDVLKLRKGYTVADAANVFDQSFKRDDLIECGCNMHARRKFVAALDGDDKRASLPISAFKKLYEIEDEVRNLDADARFEARNEKSSLVYAALIHWCQVHQPHEPPASPMGAAIRYVLNHQDALQRFLDDPDIPLDNGAVERLHVRAALTRKNFLFAGSDSGAERAAIAYTILGCCALVDVNPVEYLADVLPQVARRGKNADAADLLPVRWKASRPRYGGPAP